MPFQIICRAGRESRRQIFLVVALLLASALEPTFCNAGNSPDVSAPVTVQQTPEAIELQNGLVRVTLGKKSKGVDSIHYFVSGREVEVSDGMHLDANREKDYDEESPKAAPLVRPFRQPATRLTVIREEPDIAEVAVIAEATPEFAFRTEEHWILRRGDPGFYTYAVFRHGPGMGAVSLVQARTVLGGMSGTNLFTHYVVDDQRMKRFPTGQILETLQDATDRYAEGGIYTKYDYCDFIANDLVYGMAGNGVGLWMILPGREYINGGPLHQELTVHKGLRGNGDTKGNILLWMFQGMHFGAGAIDLKAGETWSECFGPVFVYCNQGATVPAMWADAKARAKGEAAAWPYSFVSHPDYPLKRATISGSIHFPDGSKPRGAWVILAPPGTNDWCMSAGGYTFWTKTDDSGVFTIPNVRPGRYTLFVSGGNQFYDYRKDHIIVFNSDPMDLGALTWTPVTHGKTLWQVGIADRSTGEFKGGNDVRHFDNFLRYTNDFPDDVTFTIGHSQESRDWNFAQWGWYNKHPQWTIRFDEPKALSGNATLTLGVSASSARKVEVAVNGHPAGTVAMPKTGGAPYRSGGMDSQYHVYEVTFDASWIHAGTNELTLAIQGAKPVAEAQNALPGRIGAILYDAIRLEVE